jgi:hypothetical protein
LPGDSGSQEQRMTGGDGGFVRSYVSKFQALATRAEKRQPVDEALVALVAEVRKEAAASTSGIAPEALIARLSGQLNVQARATKLPDFNLPTSQKDSIEKARERGDLLRKAASMLTGKG